MSTPLDAPRASVIIPAHNEARVIHRCLQSLENSGLHLEVVVAANGCTDNTVDVARSFAGVTVLDLPESSKVAALNSGDAQAVAYPRVYLDADISLSPTALGDLICALDTDRAIAAAPQVHFATDAASWPVRAFYNVFRELPYVRDQLVGLGVYGLSRRGRARFERFPALTSDDLFVQRLFAPDERIVVQSTFEVQVPRTLSNLIAVRVRVAKGNRQLAREGNNSARGDFSPSTGGTVTALLGLVRRRPTTTPSVLVYLAVTLVARARAQRAKAGAWERDASTR